MHVYIYVCVYICMCVCVYIYIYIYSTYHIFFIHSFIDRHLRCIRTLAIVYNVTMNTGVLISYQINVSVFC